MEKEYIVTLKDGVDYDEFWNQMDSNTIGLSFIPDRAPDIVNERPYNPRNTHYALSDQEAEILRQDPRVLDVQIPAEDDPNVIIRTLETQRSDFNQPLTFKISNCNNWGLIRCIEKISRYQGSNSNPTQFSPFPYTYDYHLDGTGVDVVIQDSGLQTDHPEFYDSNGTSRVQLIDWYSASGISGTQNANHYRDFNGHGTHVAGTVAGRNFGWAKNSRIYSVKVRGLEGSGDSGTGISVTDCFDVIRLWHQNKPVDPITGLKRPTVVNMSWGYQYSYTYNSALTGVYRGQPWAEGSYAGSSALTDRFKNYGIVNPGYGSYIPYRVSSVDADVDQMAQAGIFICIAGGNQPYVHDIPSGLDYNNYFVFNGTSYYYHRGSSPHTPYGMRVGNIDIGSYQNTSGVGYTYYDQQVGSSRIGPGINIWAPGSRIISATSNTNAWKPPTSPTPYNWLPYQFDNNYKQAILSGTSMASPQVAGVAALYLQVNPGATVSEIQDFLIKSSSDAMYDEYQSWYKNNPNTPVSYDWPYNLYGGPNRILNFPFASSTGLRNTASVTAKLNR